MTPVDASARGGAPTQGAAWQAKIGTRHLHALFASDATRGERLVREAAVHGRSTHALIRRYRRFRAEPAPK